MHHQSVLMEFCFSVVFFKSHVFIQVGKTSSSGVCFVFDLSWRDKYNTDQWQLLYHVKSGRTWSSSSTTDISCCISTDFDCPWSSLSALGWFSFKCLTGLTFCSNYCCTRFRLILCDMKVLSYEIMFKDCALLCQLFYFHFWSELVISIFKTKCFALQWLPFWYLVRLIIIFKIRNTTDYWYNCCHYIYCPKDYLVFLTSNVNGSILVIKLSDLIFI